MSDTTTLGGVFSPTWQEAIVGHMIKDKYFFIKCIEQLRFNWFQNPEIGFLFKTMQEFHKEHERQPNQKELTEVIFQKNALVTMSTANSYIAKIPIVLASAASIGMDVMSRDMTGWIKIVKFKEAIVKSTDMYNKRDYKEAISLVNTEIKDIQRASFEANDSVDFTDGVEFFKHRKEEVKDCLTIGHPAFDELLKKGSALENFGQMQDLSKIRENEGLVKKTQGGLVKGDSTIIIGPTNSGKTTTVISVIVSNILMGKDVLYITHEQKWEDLKTKIFSCILKTQTNAIENVDPETIRIAGGMFKRRLTYIPWIKSGKMYVEMVIARINAEQEKRIAETGKGYDLLVVDYPGKTKSTGTGSKVAAWEGLDAVYDQYINLCIEHRFHGIFPAQTNREGYRKAKDSKDHELVDMDNVGGSFGIVQKADNVITLNRFVSLDGSHSVIVFNIVKSRNAETGTRYASVADLAVNRTHGFGQNWKIFGPKDIVSEGQIDAAFFQTQRENNIYKQITPPELMGNPPEPPKPGETNLDTVPMEIKNP